MNSIRFTIVEKEEISDIDKLIILGVYKSYLNKLYGYDVIEKFFDDNEFDAKKSNNIINENNKIIMIYDDNTLIGAGRINLNDNNIKVKDIAIKLGDEIHKREVWKLCIAFIMVYYTKLNYRKMYIEIPFKEPYLIFRASELGFTEDPLEIIVEYDLDNYIYSKMLV